ncbi:MAG: DMT family transporter [Rhizobiaceae bacterium]
MQSLSRREIIGYLLGIIAVIMFAGSLPFTSLALTGYSPWFITFGRAVIATIASVIFIIALRRPVPRAHFLPLGIAGLFLGVGFPGFMAIALQTVPSAHGGVVLGILPLMTAVFAALFDGDRPSPLFWFCAVAGGLLVALFAVRDTGFTVSSGDLGLFAACICASIGYVISAKLSRHMTGWEVISWALILISPISLIGAFWAWQPAFAQASTSAVIALAYLGLISMYLGFFAWNVALAMGGIARVGQVQLLQTFVTLVIAYLLLGEKISWDTILFAAAVAVLVYVSRRAKIQKSDQ